MSVCMLRTRVSISTKLILTLVLTKQRKQALLSYHILEVCSAWRCYQEDDTPSEG
jgi:hypothetical protein